MSDLNEVERGQLCHAAIESLYGATGGLRQFPALLKKLIDTKAWARREVSGQVIELKSLRDLITSKPLAGWGEDPAKVEAVIRDDPEALAAFRKAMKHQGERANLDNNVIEVERSPVGNSRAYSIDRVKRECDADTVAAVMAGEMSPNAALVAAGVREVRQVYIPRDPAKAVQKLREHFGDDFLQAMRGAMDGR